MWVRNLATRSSPARGSFGGMRAGFTLGSAINSRRSLSAGLIKRNSRHTREESRNKKQEKEPGVVKGRRTDFFYYAARARQSLRAAWVFRRYFQNSRSRWLL